MASVGDYVAVVPQAKVYLAGFMARAVSGVSACGCVCMYVWVLCECVCVC